MTLVVAHRAPCSASRARAIVAAGASVIEIDVQLRDEDVVVSHYQPLRAGVQHDNWRLRVGPGRDRLLSEVLAAAIPPDTRVLLDPKPGTADGQRLLAQRLVADIAQLGGTRRVLVSTPDDGALAVYRQAGITTWRTVRTRGELSVLLRLPGVPDAGVSIRSTLLDAETVSALRERTGIICAWTVNGVARARRLAALGVHAVTTDRMRVMSALTASAGIGPAGEGVRR